MGQRRGSKKGTQDSWGSKLYAEGQGDFVSRLLVGISGFILCIWHSVLEVYLLSALQPPNRGFRFRNWVWRLSRFAAIEPSSGTEGSFGWVGLV